MHEWIAVLWESKNKLFIMDLDLDFVFIVQISLLMKFLVET